jgi:hypothetical protein
MIVPLRTSRFRNLLPTRSHPCSETRMRGLRIFHDFLTDAPVMLLPLVFRPAGEEAMKNLSGFNQLSSLRTRCAAREILSLDLVVRVRVRGDAVGDVTPAPTAPGRGASVGPARIRGGSHSTSPVPTTRSRFHRSRPDRGPRKVNGRCFTRSHPARVMNSNGPCTVRRPSAASISILA